MKKSLYNIFDRKSFNDAINVSADHESIPSYLTFLPYLSENDPLIYQYDIASLWEIRSKYYFSQYSFIDLLKKNHTIFLDLFFHQPDFFMTKLVPFLDNINKDIFKELISHWMIPYKNEYSVNYNPYEDGETPLSKYLKNSDNAASIISPKHMGYFEQWHRITAFDVKFLQNYIKDPTMYSSKLLSFIQWRELHPQFNCEQMKTVMTFYFKENDLRFICKHNKKYLDLFKDNSEELTHTYLQFFVKKCLRIYTNSSKMRIDADILDISTEYYPFICKILHQYIDDKKYFEIDDILPLLITEDNYTLLRKNIFIHLKNKSTVGYLNHSDVLKSLDDITFSFILTILDNSIINRHRGWGRVPDEILQLAQSGMISPSEIPDLWKTHIHKQYQYIFEQPELFIGNTSPIKESDLHL